MHAIYHDPVHQSSCVRSMTERSLNRATRPLEPLALSLASTSATMASRSSAFTSISVKMPFESGMSSFFLRGEHLVGLVSRELAGS